jgi:hypothetical protein
MMEMKDILTEIQTSRLRARMNALILLLSLRHNYLNSPKRIELQDRMGVFDDKLNHGKSVFSSGFINKSHMEVSRNGNRNPSFVLTKSIGRTQPLNVDRIIDVGTNKRSAHLQGLL